MFLEKIVQARKEDIDNRKASLPLRELERKIKGLPPPRNLKDRISQNDAIALIAEIKFASPSLGVIKEDVDIIRIAREYEKGGASAISVLTEPLFFKGDLSYLQQVKGETTSPLLQKDFILDPFQIYEGRAQGADAVLLIASLLSREQLGDFVELTEELHMSPLVEIHNETDLKKTSALDLPFIGINNRDLRTFEVDLATTLRLRREIPRETMVISESGIKSPEDVKLLQEAGVKAILVGEILMRSPDPGSKIRELLDI